jgi:hypothetical protein
VARDVVLTYASVGVIGGIMVGLDLSFHKQF